MLSLKRNSLLFLLAVTAFIPLFHQPCRAASFPADFLSQWGITIDILPSFPLYALKIYWEDIQLILSPPDSEKRALLLLSFCDQRLQEMYSQTATDSPTDNVRLFQSLKRYQAHYRHLQTIIDSLEVGGQEITNLLENHQQEKDQLLKLLRERRSQLGNFWFFEITTTLLPEEEFYLAREENSFLNVLGTQKGAGLELIPLDN